MNVKFNALTQLLVALTFFILFTACDKESPASTGRYEKGVFIVNEGPFGSGTGTLTYYNPDSNLVVQDVFGTENNGAALGNILQSLTFYNGKAYCVLNNSNKIVVADASTFKYEDTISGLAYPRYFLGLTDTKAYVSQWGGDGLSGSIEVINLSTNKIIKSIPLESGADRMLKIPGKDLLIVINEGGYGASDKVMKINTLTDVVLSTYSIGFNPNSLVWNNNTGVPLVLCGGKWAWVDATDPSSLYEIGGSTPAALANSNNGAKDININAEGTKIYFTDGAAVYEKNLTGSDLSVRKLFDQPCYGLFFDQKNEWLYCTDAKNFGVEGEVVIHKLNGDVVKTIPTGIGPGEVVFK